jgi:hypothetical protein
MYLARADGRRTRPQPGRSLLGCPGHAELGQRLRRVAGRAERCSYVVKVSFGFGFSVVRRGDLLECWVRTGQGCSAPGGGKALIRSRSAGLWCPGDGRRIVSQASRCGSRLAGQAGPRECVLAGGGAEVGVDLAGDVALEAADDFLLGFSFGCAAFGVGAGRRVRAQAGEHDPPQGMAGWRSPPGLSRRRTVLPEEAGIGAAPHRCAQAASLRSRSGWSRLR